MLHRKVKLSHRHYDDTRLSVQDVYGLSLQMCCQLANQSITSNLAYNINLTYSNTNLFNEMDHIAIKAHQYRGLSRVAKITKSQDFLPLSMDPGRRPTLLVWCWPMACLCPQCSSSSQQPCYGTKTGCWTLHPGRHIIAQQSRNSRGNRCWISWKIFVQFLATDSWGVKKNMIDVLNVTFLEHGINCNYNIMFYNRMYVYHI